jgi:hypothetical protein
MGRRGQQTCCTLVCALNVDVEGVGGVVKYDGEHEPALRLSG